MVGCWTFQSRTAKGTARTKAAFLADVAQQAFAFNLFEIEENHIRIFGHTAVVTGAYRNIVRMRGKPNPMKHAWRAALGVDVCTHMPQGKGGRRTTARAKGKVERPFRTVTEIHETLYHFYEPKAGADA